VTPRTGQVIRGLAATAAVVAAVIGLPTLILALGASPLEVLDIDWPSPTQAWDWLTGTDYGLQKLSVLTFVVLQAAFWVGWAWFTVLISHEFVVQIRARRGPPWPAEPAAIRRGILAALVAAILALSTPATPAAADPPAVVGASQLASPAAPRNVIAAITPASPETAPEPPTRQPTSERTGEPTEEELPGYTVHVGDTLWGLAERYLGDGLRWRHIHDLNRSTITNPDLLAAGVVLHLPPDAALPPLPADPGPGAHRLTVHPGDTLTGIAARELGDADAATRLWAINQGRTQPDGRAMTHPDRLLPGWLLWIPAHPTQPPPQPAPPPPAPPRTPAPPTAPHGQPEPDQNSQTSPPPPPDTAAPDTAAPGTAAPGTAAPGTAAPGTAAPRTAAPDTSAPGGLPLAGSADAAPAGEESPPTGVDLAAGTWVTLALAAGVAGAVVVLRRRRCHRHRPEPSLDPVPTPPRLPPTARALWAAASTTPDEETDVETDTVARRPAGRPLWAAAAHSGHDQPDTDGSAAKAATTVSEVDGPRRGWPPPPPMVTGRTDAGERSVQLTCCAGVGLDGDGAAAAARAVMIELLGEDSLHPPQVHLTAEAAHRLFGGHPAVSVSTPGVLACHDSTDHALQAVETELLRRLRLFDNTPPTAAAVDEQLGQLRVDDPGEPLPTLLLLTTTPSPRAQPQLTGLLGLGRRVGIVGLVLGNWPTGLTVDHKHRVTATRGEEVTHLRGAELAALTEADAAQLLAVHLAARGGPDISAHDCPGQTNAEPTPQPAERPDPPPVPAPDQPAVYVRVLGRVRIDTNGSEMGAGLERRGRQVLAYLAASTDPVPATTLDEEIFADAEDPRKLRHTIISRTRTALTTRAGTTAPIIQLVNGRYRLNPDVVDSDAWRLQRILAAARTTSTDRQRGEHLRALLELDIAEPFDGAAYDWAEQLAAPLRHQAVNALVMLAQLTESDDPATALAALAAATTLNPYAEQLYYQAIGIQVRNHDHHAAHQLYQQLEHLLADDLHKEPDKPIHELISAHTTTASEQANTPAR
jgi:nucleoid-associated protein YgaU/DNA-binding SARP family transcriptional activator